MYPDLGIELSLIKTNTLQYDYIVEDHEFHSETYAPYYTAYYQEKAVVID